MYLPEPKGQQAEVVAYPHRGHVVVLGTAGAGKTTMAIHRAALLAHETAENPGRVLLVTFNKALVAYLRQWKPSKLNRVQVEHYHQFARGYLNSRGLMRSYGDIADERERRALIDLAVQQVRKETGGTPRPLFERASPQFFYDELRFIQQHGLSPEEYVQLERSGRGRGFPRNHRPALLRIFEVYRQLRQAGGQRYDWEDIAGETLGALSEDDGARRYTHIVIDEGQDFSPQMLRSLAAAIPEHGSLTFFGDMAQQIYGRHVSWARAGLRVPRRVRRFSHNYRNTREIAALGLAVAEMPYFADVPDMVAPDGSEPAGAKPSVVHCRSRREEFDFVVQRAYDGAQTGSVGVLFRENSDADRFRVAFPGAQRLRRDMSVWKPGPGISYGTVHSAKGYEFDTVFLVGLSEAAWPSPGLLAEQEPEIAAAIDGQLLYVGITRARSELVITYVDRATQLLPENRGLWQDQTP